MRSCQVRSLEKGVKVCNKHQGDCENAQSTAKVSSGTGCSAKMSSLDFVGIPA